MAYSKNSRSRLTLHALTGVLVLALAACGSDDMQGATQGTPPTGRTEAAPTNSTTEPRMEDGVQIVEITVGEVFEPNRIRLDAGTPARLIFTRTTEDTCVKQVNVPTFEIGPIDLPLNEPISVEFTPDEVGDFTFVCGMDMVSGSLVVQS